MNYILRGESKKQTLYNYIQNVIAHSKLLQSINYFI